MSFSGSTSMNTNIVSELDDLNALYDDLKGLLKLHITSDCLETGD